MRRLVALVGVLGLLGVGCTSSGEPAPSVPPSVSLPVTLRTPVELREVAARSAGACSRPLKPPPGGLVVTYEGSECLTLNPPALTVTRAARVAVFAAAPLGYGVEVELEPAQAAELETLTGRLAGGGRLAIVVGGEVLNAPFPQEAVTTGSVVVSTPDEASARALAGRLTG